MRGRADDPAYKGAIRVDAASKQVMVVNNFLGKGADGALEMPKEAGAETGNTTV